MELPLLALPDYTLFPNTLVPFHVYEPRLVRMISDALAGERLLVIGGYDATVPTATGTYPTVAPTAGLARVLRDRSYPDGRMDLFVHGIARVRIDAELSTEPWRVVSVSRIEDVLEEPLGGVLGRLVAVASTLFSHLGDDGEPVHELLGGSADPAVLSNRLASAWVGPFADRQRLLAERCPVRRTRQLTEHLGRAILEHAFVESRPAT